MYIYIPWTRIFQYFTWGRNIGIININANQIIKTQENFKNLCAEQFRNISYFKQIKVYIPWTRVFQYFTWMLHRHTQNKRKNTIKHQINKKLQKFVTWAVRDKSYFKQIKPFFSCSCNKYCSKYQDILKKNINI